MAIFHRHRAPAATPAPHFARAPQQRAQRAQVRTPQSPFRPTAAPAATPAPPPSSALPSTWDLHAVHVQSLLQDQFRQTGAPAQPQHVQPQHVQPQHVQPQHVQPQQAPRPQGFVPPADWFGEHPDAGRWDTQPWAGWEDREGFGEMGRAAPGSRPLAPPSSTPASAPQQQHALQPQQQQQHTPQPARPTPYLGVMSMTPPPPLAAAAAAAAAAITPPLAPAAVEPPAVGSGFGQPARSTFPLPMGARQHAEVRALADAQHQREEEELRQQQEEQRRRLFEELHTDKLDISIRLYREMRFTPGEIVVYQGHNELRLGRVSLVPAYAPKRWSTGYQYYIHWRTGSFTGPLLDEPVYTDAGSWVWQDYLLSADPRNTKWYAGPHLVREASRRSTKQTPRLAQDHSPWPLAEHDRDPAADSDSGERHWNAAFSGPDALERSADDHEDEDEDYDVDRVTPYVANSFPSRPSNPSDC